MGAWDIAILMCIRDIGKKAMLQQIYRKISNYIELNNNHLKATEYGGRPAFQHEVRKFISNLCESGYLVREDRGEYSITEKGANRINFDVNIEDLDI